MKRCKHCKDPFTPIRSTLEKYCQKSECIRVFVAEAKAKQWKKTKKAKKEQLMSLSDWHKLAQQVFNKFIRIRDKDKPCISCNAKAGTYTLTAGHFIPSTNKSVTYNEDNLHGQCWFNCNSSKSGNLHEYRIGLIDRIGIERLEELEAEARKTRKFTIDELKGIIAEYKRKLKEL